MSIAEIRQRASNEALERALNKAGAVLTDDEIRLLAMEMARATPAETADIWIAMLPPEERRVGIAAPLMTGTDDNFADGIGLLMAMAAYGKDKANSAEFEEWLRDGSTYGEYFSGVDDWTIQTAWQGRVRVRHVSGAIQVPRAKLRYDAAGGAKRMWYVLGLTAAQVRTGDVTRQKAQAQLGPNVNAAAGRLDDDLDAEMSKP